MRSIMTVLAALVLLGAQACVSLEVPHAAERLAATARVIEAAAAHHDDLVVIADPAERAAALAGFVRLAGEHRAYAEELVAASGGSLEEVARLEAKWRAEAAERARRRREAAAAGAGVTATAVPR